jgi:Fic family protein
MAKQIGNAHLMQKMNRLKVLNFIRKNPGTSRPLIAEQTGLSLSSITNVTSYLLNLGLLTESGIVNQSRYRTRTLPSAGAILKPEDAPEKQISFEV